MRKIYTMPPTPKQDTDELKAIEAGMVELRDWLEQLADRADAISAKYSLEQCRRFGCAYAKGRKLYCSRADSCIHSMTAHGATRDMYLHVERTAKRREPCPTLGWRTAVSAGDRWKDEWHPYIVSRETPRTLVLDDGTVLLKSTLRTVDDVPFVKSYGGCTFFCADGGDDAMDAAAAILKSETEMPVLDVMHGCRI